MGHAAIGQPAMNMVQEDRDKKMKARCRMLEWRLVGNFSTRVHPGIGLPGCRKQYGHQAGSLVISGMDAQMMGLVMGWMSI